MRKQGWLRRKRTMVDDGLKSINQTHDIAYLTTLPSSFMIDRNALPITAPVCDCFFNSPILRTPTTAKPATPAA